MDQKAIEAARQQGVEDAERARNAAPTDPALRLAWAHGFGQLDQLQAAVDYARDLGLTWRDIGDVLGMHMRTAQSKFSGAERQARYYRRKRAQLAREQRDEQTGDE